jgi:hypothetical protein
MAQTSISNTSTTYKTNGSIDVVAQTVIDLNKTLADANSVADFHSASIPLRWRAIAEYFAGLTEAERKLQTQNWSGGANLDEGTLAFIDYVNAQLYNVIRGAGLTVTSSTAAHTGVPLTPTSVAAAAGNTKLTITWTDVPPASTSYKIYYRACPLGTEDTAFVLAGSLYGGGLEDPAGTDITGLSNGTQYGVVVAGINACSAGSGITHGNFSSPKYQTPAA